MLCHDVRWTNTRAWQSRKPQLRFRLDSQIEVVMNNSLMASQTKRLSDQIAGVHKRIVPAGNQRGIQNSFDPDGLDVNKLTDTELSEFTAVAGVFDSAKRKARIGRDHAVNEDATRCDLLDKTLLF